MITGERIPLPADNVVWREVSDGAVLVSPEAGKIRVLNEVGSQVWRLIDGRTSIATIEETLLRRYDSIPREQLSQDLQQFLRDLASRGLLTWEEPS